MPSATAPSFFYWELSLGVVVNREGHFVGHVSLVVVILVIAGFGAETGRFAPADQVSGGAGWHGPDEPGAKGAAQIAGLLGGFRELAADLMWVKAYRDWSRRDLAAMRRSLDHAVGLNPRAQTFWLNGARMLAYDAAAWRQPARESDPDLRSSRIRQEQLGEALAFLERGRRAMPGRWELDVEAAVLSMNLTQNWAGALMELEGLGEVEGVPYYVGRVRAELLVKLGREEEALAWLRTWVVSLPADDPAARIDVVQARIAELERQK